MLIDEIIDIIKFYDTHDKYYYNMLKEDIFLNKEYNTINWIDFLNKKIINFLKDRKIISL